MKKKIGLIGALALVVIFYIMAFVMDVPGWDPTGEKLSSASFIYAGIFLAVIVLMLAQSMPDWVVVMLAAALLILTDALCVKGGVWAPNPDTGQSCFTTGGLFGAFSGSTVWLIIMVFALSAGIGNSGLLNRIALKLLSIFPPTYTGAVFAMMLTGTVLSPLIPSVNAKVNILIPFATATTEEMKMEPKSKGALGLFSACYLPAYLGGNCFLTGSVYASVMAGFITQFATNGIKGATFNWTSWLGATFIWFIILLVGTYVYCVIICRPKEKVEFSKDFYRERIKEMGPMQKKEKIAAVILIGALILWSTGSIHGMDTGMIGWLAICIMCMTGLLAPMDIATKVPWGLVIFIGVLLGMAGYMQTLGWSTAIAGVLRPVLAPVVGSKIAFVVVLCIFTYLLRFVIIEQNTVFFVILAIFGGLLAGANINLFVMTFVVFMSSMTWSTTYMNPFAMATLNVAGGKYVTYKEFQKTSFFYMLINLAGCLASIPLWSALGFFG